MDRWIARRALAGLTAAAMLVAIAAAWPRPMPDLPPTDQRPIVDPADAASLSFADVIAGAGSIDDRKRRFVAYVLPLIDAVNAEILHQRRDVLRLRARIIAARPLTRAERRWLRAIEVRYGAMPGDIEELLARVDVVPASLALAQAALESGWGTSRFVRDGNALFGQRTWDDRSGLVPGDRDADATFAVRSFVDLQASVTAYMLNLNSHAAYNGFRRARSVLRGHGQVSGFVLAGSMTSYSEIGADYVTTVRAIIRGNDLGGHDRAPIDG